MPIPFVAAFCRLRYNGHSRILPLAAATKYSMTFLEGKMMKLITTDDGSNTVLIHSIGETYHSTFGAIQESEHVFIEAGLRLCRKKRPTLLEVGFGSGLNAYLTMIYAINNDL